MKNTFMLAALIAVSIPSSSYARGEDAAINRNDTMISSDTDRTNSRTESWTSAPKISNWDRSAVSDDSMSTNKYNNNMNPSIYNSNNSMNNGRYTTNNGTRSRSTNK